MQLRGHTGRLHAAAAPNPPLERARGVLKHDTAVRRRGLLHRGNIMCCFAATLSIFVLPGGFLLGAEDEAARSENTARPAGAPDPPAPAQALAVYAEVERWVHAWQTPERAPALFPDVTAASITLRLAGGVVGRGTAVSSRAQGDAGIIVEAVRLALEEGTGRMPIERDALFEESLREMAPSVTISLELAGPLVPITVREYADVSLEIAAGAEGVGVRIGDRIDVLFPGTMLSNQTEPGSGLSAVVSRLTDDARLGLKKPGELADEHSAVFYRFRTVHLAQTAPGRTPEFLQRGGRLIDQRQLTSAHLRQWADGMADHLLGRMWPGPEGLGIGGTYNPLTGASEPTSAGPAEQALCALALVRYSESVRPRGDRWIEVRAAAERLMRDLARLEEGEKDPLTEPAAVAAAWITLQALSIEHPPGGLATLRADHDELQAFFEKLGAVMNTWEEDFAIVPAQQRAIAAWALARRCVEQRMRKPAVERAVRQLYTETPPGMLVGQMPWLGWAELTLARIEVEPGVRREIPAAVALREMREQVWRHQLSAADLSGERLDLAGGIVFTAGRNPLPTWHTARPMAFIATMLGDERLTEQEEFAGELSRLLSSLRFLRQLSAGEMEGHMYRLPRRAMWGVRGSVWDQRMAPEATAMGLLTVGELVRSLESVRQR